MHGKWREYRALFSLTTGRRRRRRRRILSKVIWCFVLRRLPHPRHLSTPPTPRPAINLAFPFLAHPSEARVIFLFLLFSTFFWFAYSCIFPSAFPVSRVLPSTTSFLSPSRKPPKQSVSLCTIACHFSILCHFLDSCNLFNIHVLNKFDIHSCTILLVSLPIIGRREVNGKEVHYTQVCIEDG